MNLFFDHALIYGVSGKHFRDFLCIRNAEVKQGASFSSSERWNCGQHGGPDQQISHDDPRQLGAAEIHRGSSGDRESVEADGPGSETVPTSTYEPQELAAVHPRHTSRHLPAPEVHLRRVRGPHARAGRQRVLSGVPGEPDDQVSEVRKTVQGQQGADVRRVVVLPAQPHPLFADILTHGR